MFLDGGELIAAGPKGDDQMRGIVGTVITVVVIVIVLRLLNVI